MHQYELFECSNEDGSGLTPTGKVVELGTGWDRGQIVQAVMKIYGFTQYHDYYTCTGQVGAEHIKLRYNYSGPYHFVLRKR